MIDCHVIERFEHTDIFMKRIKHYPRGNIQCTDHTFFRLSEKQRELFTHKDIEEFLLEKIPVRVGIQKNGNYSAFYRFAKQRYIRIILSFKPDRIKVITFFIVEKDKLPRGSV